VKYNDASGNRGNENLINPYAPNLIKIPASITDPAKGASTCAKGNQIWKGNIGTLTAKLAKKHKNIIF
jgi:hypothetical protein